MKFFPKRFIKNKIFNMIPDFIWNFVFFIHFLIILPVLGFKERTLPVPLSITEPVLGGSPNLATAKNKESFTNK